MAGSPEPSAKARKLQAPEPVPLHALSLADQSRVQVSWDVEFEDGTQGMAWWGATLFVDENENETPTTLLYDAEFGFEEEKRCVSFCSKDELWDFALNERMTWRRFSDDSQLDQAAEDQGQIGVGSLVKARIDASGDKYSAIVDSINEDGTVDLALEDKTERKVVQSVPLDLIDRVALSNEACAALEDDDKEEKIDGVNAFFEAYCRTLMNSETFKNLDASQRAVASEKVRSLFPYFEAEMEEFKKERGVGAIVTQVDIKDILPRVMERSRQAAAL